MLIPERSLKVIKRKQKKLENLYNELGHQLHNQVERILRLEILDLLTHELGNDTLWLTRHHIGGDYDE